jgi:hypothetical protein
MSSSKLWTARFRGRKGSCRRLIASHLKQHRPLHTASQLPQDYDQLSHSFTNVRTSLGHCSMLQNCENLIRFSPLFDAMRFWIIYLPVSYLETETSIIRYWCGNLFLRLKEECNLDSIFYNTVTNMTIARQRLCKLITEVTQSTVEGSPFLGSKSLGMFRSNCQNTDNNRGTVWDGGLYSVRLDL